MNMNQPRRAPKPEFLADGLLVVDKPPRCTSAQVLNQIKRWARPRKIGHTGTLDPFATGVLVVCFNQATKLAGFLTEQDKTYQGVLRLGVETDTHDLTGQVLRKRSVTSTPDEVRAAAVKLVGAQRQRPPAYSAIKQDGQPLYLKARRGEAVEEELEPRDVVIHSLDVEKIDGVRVAFRVHCSKGAYIRALARDWGHLLGCGAHLEELRRLSAGRFVVEDAMLMGQVEGLVGQGRLAQRLIPLTHALPDWPQARLDEAGLARVRQGHAPSAGELSGLALRHLKVGQRLMLIDPQGALAALAEMKPTPGGEGLTAWPFRVLSLQEV